MKLVFARLYISSQKLEVGVEDPPGKRRVVEVTMMTDVETVFPPANWLEVVQGEVEYQKSGEASAVPRMFP